VIFAQWFGDDHSFNLQPRIETLEKKINELKIGQNHVIEELEEQKLINKGLTKDSQRLTEALVTNKKT